MHTCVKIVGVPSVSMIVVLNIGRLCVMVIVFTATFNNISAIPWRLVLLVEETGEKYRPAASH